MSSDGRYDVYKYGPKNTATNSGALIFLYDSLTGSNTLILSNAFALGGPYEDDAYGPEISVDGRYVAWVTNIVDGTGTNHSAVRLFDTQTLTDTLASQDQSGGISPNTFSDTPVLSSDGRFISFLSSANDLATNQVAGGGTYLYHRDQQSGTTRLANVDLAGMVPGVPSVSSDGRFIAFATGDMLLNGDTNRACDVFVRDTMTESNELISMRDASVLSQSASGISLAPQYSVSSDGRWIAFTSLAPDLVTNDFNNSQDVFAYDRQKGSNILVSIGNTGYAATGGPSFNPVISPNGRYVAFLSSATDLLVTNMTNFGYFANNLYLRDLQYGTTALVAGNRVPSVPTDSLNPTFSLDNQYLAYVRRTNDNFGSSSANFSVLRYDVSSGTTTNFPGNVSPAIAPSMSADGRFTAFALVGVSAVVWDSQDLILYSSFFRPSSVLSLALSPTGTRLAMQNTTSVYVVDFRANAASNTFLYSASAGVPPIRNGPVWSADGRYFVFAGAVSAFPWSNNVFLYDIQTKSTNLVSVNSNHTGGANGICDWPVISGDGRFILFSSNAKNIVPLPNTNEANLYVFDRVTGSNSLLAVIPPSTSWNEWRAKPAINGDGRVIVFQSPGSMSTGGLDLNRSQDIFAISRAPWGATDSDTDGIPDAWMIYYFGHATGQGGDQSLALDDADGDGMVNLQEYLAGTDPRIAASVLRLGISSVPSGNGLLLTWPAVPGKSYKVQYKNSLTDASWTDVSEPITFGGLTASYRATPSQSARYYRAVASD
jgi:Tol biopolymer transport system component